MVTKERIGIHLSPEDIKTSSLSKSPQKTLQREARPFTPDRIKRVLLAASSIAKNQDPEVAFSASPAIIARCHEVVTGAINAGWLPKNLAERTAKLIELEEEYKPWRIMENSNTQDTSFGIINTSGGQNGHS